jgi:hypothetical protein
MRTASIDRLVDRRRFDTWLVTEHDHDCIRSGCGFESGDERRALTCLVIGIHDDGYIEPGKNLSNRSSLMSEHDKDIVEPRRDTSFDHVNDQGLAVEVEKLLGPA